MHDSRTAGEIRLLTLDDEYLGMLSECVIYSRPSTKPVVQKELQS